MLFSPQRLPVSWTSVCIALAGAVYCGVQAAVPGGDAACSGTGCRLFANFSIHGISLWWVGVAYFAFMVLVCLRRAQSVALATAWLALAADALLLALMLVSAACTACLGAAAFMGVLFLALRRHGNRRAAPVRPSFLFFIWLGLFIAALASAGTEQVRPWRMAGTETMERRVYFSPSCPACRDAVALFAGQAAFIPVAEQESDYAAIRAMFMALEKGKTMPEALREANNAPIPRAASLENAVFRLRLLRNKAEVLRLGFDRLPLIMVNGIPQALRPAPDAGRSGGRAPRNAPAALPPELSPVDSCGGYDTQPCDPPR